LSARSMRHGGWRGMVRQPPLLSTPTALTPPCRMLAEVDETLAEVDETLLQGDETIALSCRPDCSMRHVP
jgi:hypothetical protein